jgi:hypothetical protein
VHHPTSFFPDEESMEVARHPVICVRGYAMTEDERNETAADPFCGFDFGCRTVCENGLDILDPDRQPHTGADGAPAKGLPPQSIMICGSRGMP